ncbi:MAG: hypothetical protein IT426_06970 [Pirellulales bacterium]|nr:hypothetical protein [Pirellulales bacterium]
MDYLASKASYEAIENKVALYRVSFSDDIKKQLENTLSQMTLLLKNATRENIDPELIRESEKTKEMIEDMLQRGTPLKINLETGLVVQSGIVGKRAWVRDFQWHENVDESIFRVDDRRWVDHTDPISGLGSTDIMMFKHSGVWRPGQQTGELETKLLNYKTGDIRRVPYRGAQCVPLCFSQDRKRVYVGGLNLETALIGLFEINLEHLTQKQLGLPLLNRGYVLGGALSLDEKHLAVIQCGINNKYPSFSNQVVLVDLASGEAKPLGKPLDGAFLSWIPDGSGLVLVSRESKRLDQPPEGTVCRMDIQGNITALLKGNMPCALSPKPFILYEGDNRKWMTCDVDGKEIKPFMNGLNGFSFPSPSPDGKQLIMMQFGSADGPVPHLIDISSGKITPIRVPPGLWATPVWK